MTGGTNTFTGTTLVSNGTISINSGLLKIVGNWSNAGFVTDSSSLTLAGKVSNTGSISLHDGGSLSTFLSIGADDVTLTGGGTVALVTNSGDFNYNEITGGNTTTATTLHNVDNTISGAGRIGRYGVYSGYDPGNLLILDNQAAGKIDADNAGASLTLNPASIGNAGTIEDTAAGGLAITNTTVTQTGNGVISANGAGSHVDLNGATIVGGLLSSSGGGVFNVTGGADLLDGSTVLGAVTNAAKLQILGGQAVTLNGSIVNTGNIELHDAGNLRSPTSSSAT